MKYFLCLLSIIFCSCTQSTITHDTAYLQKLAAAYEEVKVGSDMQNELDTLEIYLDEAIRQKDSREENYARKQKICCYLNYMEFDKLYKEVAIQSDFFYKHENWDGYFFTLSYEIDGLLRQNRHESALIKAKKMYDEAQKIPSDEGMGIATFNIGNIYHHTFRNEEAVTYLKKAIELIQKTENNWLLIDIYFSLGEALFNLQKYEASIFYTKEQEKEILKLEKSQPGTNLAALWQNCYYNFTHAYCELKNLEKAEYYYQKLRDNEGSSDVFLTLTLGAERRLMRLKNENQRYIAITDTLLSGLSNTGNKLYISYLIEEKADLLMDMQQYREAATLYNDVIQIRDTLKTEALGAQLDDLRSIYDLDHVTAEKEKNHLYAIIAFTGCFFLVILLIIYALYSRRLKEKNRNLFNRIQELARLEKEQQRIEREEVTRLDEQSIPLPDDTPADPSREELLVKRLRVWLNTENRFTQPDINRKQMADYLGTNEKYLADAIRNQCDGQTVSDFINTLRLSYARDLLIGQPDMTIESIAMDAGLNTRTTLFRLFRKHYGMSPSEFRSVLKQGCEVKYPN